MKYGHISVDIDFDEIVCNMSSYEKQELLKELQDEVGNHITGTKTNHEYNDAVLKLLDNDWKLTNEDVETIMKISDKIP